MRVTYISAKTGEEVTVEGIRVRTGEEMYLTIDTNAGVLRIPREAVVRTEQDG